MKNCNVPFGGFYNSLHSSLIDSMLDNFYSDEDGNALCYDDLNINYDEIHAQYIKAYINNLNEFLRDDFEIDVTFHNLRLDSPREYNFTTDKINCNISDLNCKKLINLFKKDNYFLSALRDYTKSYDGYISFYNYDEALNNKDDILIEYVMQYICKLLDNDTYLTYYDMNNVYELLNYIDLPQIKEGL